LRRDWPEFMAQLRRLRNAVWNGGWGHE
jgi:hypothetical protein